MNISKKIVLSMVLSVLGVPMFAIAQGGGSASPTSNITINNPTNAGSDIMSILVALLNNVVMPVAAVAVVVWIIYAGFTYLTAQGKPAEIQKAHQRLLWSLIGAGILLGAAGIAKVVETTVKALLA